MSKSLGNVVDPYDLIKKYGSDILRLWVAYEDFSQDISYSDESYVRVTEAYRRIRNTFRFILGNISDFDHTKHSVSYKDLSNIDKWMLSKLHENIRDIKSAYDNFEFYKVYHLVHNFCAVELSSFYLDIAKDTLYTNKKDSKERRGIQTVMYQTADSILKLLAPIIPFTAEEVWTYMPTPKEESIHLAGIPDFNKDYINPEIEDQWSKILNLRVETSRVLEEKRKNKEIGHSLDADIKLTVTKDVYKAVTSNNVDLSSIFIVSNVEVKEGDTLSITVDKSPFKKCARCWQYKKEVGTIKDNEELCKRCLEAII
jgi:isoleucyl-tRNA synthetase